MSIGLGITDWNGAQSGTTNIVSVSSNAKNTQNDNNSFLVVEVSNLNADVPVVTDNKGNTWLLANTVDIFGFQKTGLYYCKKANGGTGHIVTATWTNGVTLASIGWTEFTGVGDVVVDSNPAGNFNSSGNSPTAAPSITPTVIGQLVVASFATYSGGAYTITDSGSPWTVAVKYETGVYQTGAIAYALPGAVTPIQDTFAYSGFGYSAALALSVKPNVPITLAGGGTSASAGTGVLSTGIKLAGTPTSVSTAVGLLMRLMGSAASTAAGTGALSTAIQLAAAAISTTVGSGHLPGSIALAGDVLTATSAAAVLTNWTQVTLTAPLYIGPQGILDQHFWVDSKPQVGSIIFYDATHITIAPNGEIGSDVTDCIAVCQFKDTNNEWAYGEVRFTSGLAGYSDAVASAVGSMTTSIRLLAAASSLVTAVAGLNTQIQLRAQLISVTTASAALVGQVQFTAAAADTFVSAGVLSGTDSSLAGNAVSTSIVNGLLNAQIKLVGTASSLVTSVAALATQIRLQSAVLTSSAASAGLTSGTPLVGLASITAVATGALLTAIRVSGAALAIVQAAGDLTTHIRLVSAAVSASSATGNLTVFTGIAASAQSVSTAVGSLTALVTMRASAFSLSASDAALLTAIPLVAAALGADSATANLSATGSQVGLYVADPYFVIGVRRQYFTQRFPTIAPGEGHVLDFSFADELLPGEHLQGIISLNAIASAGVDGTLPGDLLDGVPAYDSTLSQVLQPIHGAIQDNDYYFTVSVKTNNPFKTLTRFGILSVRA